MAILTITVTQFILGSSYLFFWNADPKYVWPSEKVSWYDAVLSWIFNWKYLTLGATVVAVTVFLLWVVGRQLRCSYLLYEDQQHLAVPDENAQHCQPDQSPSRQHFGRGHLCRRRSILVALCRLSDTI